MIVGIYQLNTGGIFLYLILDIILKILNKSLHNNNYFVPSLIYRKDDSNFYIECEGRYNYYYALHFILYFSGIVVIIISGYLHIGFGSLLFLDVFIKPDDNRVRKYITSILSFILVISLLLVPICYNAVYFFFMM